MVCIQTSYACLLSQDVSRLPGLPGGSWAVVASALYFSATYLHGLLHVSGMSASNIANYITAIRSLMIFYGVNIDCLRDQRIPYFIKAITMNRPIQPHLPPKLDQVSLLKIITVAEVLPFSIVYVPLYLLPFPIYYLIPPPSLIPPGSCVKGT